MAIKHLSIVLAHPDDESFGMGGTLAKYASQGVAIHLILATRGEAGIPGMDPHATGELREVEVRSACQVLGVQTLDFLGFLDGHLAAIPDEVGVERVAERLREQKPDVVITFGPDGISGHADHMTVSRWTTSAFDRLSTATDGPDKLYYLAPSEATQQACGGPPSADTAGGPMAYIDIDAFKSRKLLAMQQHESQHPLFTGRPEDEASQLACHEAFRLARPTQGSTAGVLEDDLFTSFEFVHGHRTGLLPGDAENQHGRGVDAAASITGAASVGYVLDT